MKQYVVDLLSATRTQHGPAPRRLPALGAAAACAPPAPPPPSTAATTSLPDDVQALAEPVLAHRLLLTAEAQVARRSAEDVVADLVERTPLPTCPGALAGAATRCAPRCRA